MVESEGYELILGSSIDEQFGPVILFGSGGHLVEVYDDRALALPPLNTNLAARLMEQTRIFRGLQGIRGSAAVDLKKLENLLVRFSTMVVNHPSIKEIEINPLLASAGGMIALDARILLHDAAIQNLPKPAIRPYPARYASQWRMKSGIEVLLRPIRPEDEPAMVKFHESLSDRSVYLRFFHMEKLSARVAHERLLRKCFIDYDREMALVAERTDSETGEREITAVGRLTRQPGTGDAEVAVLVADRYQHQGLGAELLERLIRIARHERLKRVVATILPENIGMRTLASRQGFLIQKGPDLDDVIIAVLTLPDGK
jgi:acetyltransferase